MFTVFGDIVLDIVVLPLEAVARDTDTQARITPTGGGSAANVAAWAARAGAEVAFFGQAGDDPVGRALKAELAAEGVAVDPPAGDLRLDPLSPTGIIIVDVEAGEAELAGGAGAHSGPARTMITDRGANLTVAPDLIPPAAIARCDWFHLTGYSLFEPRPRAVALAALGECRRLGRPFSVDPSSSRFLEASGPDRFLDDVAGAAVLLPNREEAALLSGVGDPARAALALCRRFPIVVVKLGGDGCLVAAGGRFEAVPPAGTGEPALDPTGAGDAFAAGFLCRLIEEIGGANRPGALQPRWALPAAVRAARAGAGLGALAARVVGGRGRPDTPRATRTSG